METLLINHYKLYYYYYYYYIIIIIIIIITIVNEPNYHSLMIPSWRDLAPSFLYNNVKDKISGLKGFFPDLRRSFYSVIIPPAEFIKFAWDLSLMIYDIYSFNFD